MNLVLLVSNNQYLLPNGLYELGIKQWLGWVAVVRRAVVTHPKLSGSSCTQEGTSVTTENPSAAPVITWLPHRAKDPREKKEKKV